MAGSNRERARRKRLGAHEFQDREHVVRSSSDRSFGLVFAAFFAILAAFAVYSGSGLWPLWLGLSAAFAVAAAARPAILARANRLWTRLGLILSAVVSPVVLGIVFYGCVTPIGLVLRLAGKDLLRLRREPELESYWIVRDPPGPPGDSLDHQF